MKMIAIRKRSSKLKIQSVEMPNFLYTETVIAHKKHCTNNKLITTKTDNYEKNTFSFWITCIFSI